MEANDAVRGRLLALIQASPGTSTRGLATGVGLSESTVAYHLRRLARSGQVQSQLLGRDRCWYATLCGLCPVLRRALPILARQPVAKVAAALGPTPLTTNEVADATGLSPGTARWAGLSLDRTFLSERSRGRRISLREGAEVCLQKARSGEPCGLWGECAISVAWREHERARLTGIASVADRAGLAPRPRR